ncbi:MAG: S-layer protein domain-containing protein [Methanothrix sp.]
MKKLLEGFAGNNMPHRDLWLPNSSYLKMRYNRRIIAIFFSILLALIAVSATSLVQGAEIRGDVALGSYKWFPQNFAGFYYDINDSIGNENIIINISNNRASGIEPYGIIYTTQAQAKNFSFADWGTYYVIGFLEKGYFAGYADSSDRKKNLFYNESTNSNALGLDQLNEILIDDDSELTIDVGKSLILKQGYKLNIKSINHDGRQFFLELEKDGFPIETQIISPGNTYIYRNRIGRVDDLVILAVHFKDTSVTSNNSSIINAIWQISDVPINVETGTEYGILSITESDPTKIVMSNKNKDIFLRKGSIINIVGKKSRTPWLKEQLYYNSTNLNLIVANNDTLRYYISTNYEIPGTYEIRSPVANKSVLWTPQNFSGFYYDIDNNIGDETLKLNIVDRSILRGSTPYGLIYRTTAQSEELSFRDWGAYYAIGFLGKKYFAGYVEDTRPEKNMLYSRSLNNIQFGKLAEVLFDDDHEMIIEMSRSLLLKQGYKVIFKDYDISGHRIMVVLEKDGNLISSQIIDFNGNERDKSFIYINDSTVSIALHFKGIFLSNGSGYAILDGIWQLSETPIEIERGENYGLMTISSLSFSPLIIEMVNKGNEIDLMKTNKLSLFNNFWIKSNGHSFYLYYLDHIISNTYPKIINITWNINNETALIQEMNNTILFKNSEVRFMGYATDNETSQEDLRYNWFLNRVPLGSKNNFSILLEPGVYNNITLMVTDSDGANAVKTEGIKIEVLSQTREDYQYFRDIKNPFIFVLLILTIIFSFFKRLFIFWYRPFFFAVAVIAFYCVLYYISYYTFSPLHGLFKMKDSGIIQLLILAVIIPFANYFIISSFSNLDAREISYKKDKKSKLMIINYIFRSLDYLNREAKIWYTWYFTMLFMFLIVSLLIWFIPSEFKPEDIDLQYNFIFWYYSMMTQTFGAILAIIAMVAIGKVTLCKDKLFLLKVKNFILIYTTIIILSITGLIARLIPPFWPREINSLSEILPLFIFEVSLLLAVPALVCLGQMILDYINFSLELDH